MTDETFPHEIWADLDHWIEGPAASDLRAQGYMKYIRADRIEELEAKLAKAVEGFEELARLGNGDRYGNSFGNLIAQKYIEELTGGKDD